MQHFKLIFLAVLVAIASIYVDFFSFARPTFPVHRRGVVVVTGASTGIGRHVAVQLMKDNYAVLAGVRKESDKQSLINEAAGIFSGKGEFTGGLLLPVILDVTNPEHVQGIVDQVTTTLQGTGLPLVALVNNAGVAGLNVVEDTDMDRMRHLYDVNVFGLMDITRALLPLLRSSRGRVVNIASVAGQVAAPLMGIYSSSKFAVEGLTDALRREMHPHGVAVSIVEPGYVATPILHKPEVFDEALMKLYGAASWMEGMQRAASKASPVTVTTAAIKDAIVSPTPRERYPCANVDGFPVWVLLKVQWALPTHVFDAIMVHF